MMTVAELNEYQLPAHVTAVRTCYGVWERHGEVWRTITGEERHASTDVILRERGPLSFYRDVPPREMCQCTDTDVCAFHTLTGAEPDKDVVAALVAGPSEIQFMYVRVGVDEWAEDSNQTRTVRTSRLLPYTPRLMWLVEKT